MCARCVLALGRVHAGARACSRAVVAGRFWCSYAWVSLTQTACARPRAACAPGCARVQACVRSYRRCVRGVYAVCGGVALARVVGACLFFVLRRLAAYLFCFLSRRCRACLFWLCISLCISLCVVLCIGMCSSLFLFLFPPLSRLSYLLV